MRSKVRNTYIDFYRGIAAINIVLIHTVYWSGENYLGESILYTLVLLIDVPQFIFLSGWSAFYTANVKKTFDNLLKIWIQYIIFIVMIDIVCNMILYPGTFSNTEFLYQLVFLGNTPYLPVIAGSLWFMPIWIPVALIGSILIALLKYISTKHTAYIRIIAFLLIGIIWFSITNSSSYFLLSRNFCFYMTFFLLGYLMADHFIKVRLWQYCAVCMVITLLWLLTGQVFQLSPRDLQSAKMLPHLMYLIASMLSITTAIYLRGKIDSVVKWCSVIRFIGRNALPFYFSQGIGSSIIYYIYPRVLSYGPYATLAICFAANLLITLVCGMGLLQIYRGIFFITSCIKVRLPKGNTLNLQNSSTEPEKECRGDEH